MRVAVAGKGGAGKTTIAATLARLTARDGHQVLALDADSNPNLAVALGIASDITVPTLPASIVSRRLDGPALGLSVDEVVAAHTVAAPDGVRLALMGMPAHAEEGCMCAAHATVAALLADVGTSERVGILDLEASPEHFSRGTARAVDVLLFVAEPYYRSLETVRRMAALAAELPIPRVGVVANKLRSGDDRDAIAAFCERHDLELLAAVPWADAVLDADRSQIPVLDAEVAPVIAAVDALRRTITSTEHAAAS